MHPSASGDEFNPNPEVAELPKAGSTGHWPVPSGDSPFGTGEAAELFRASVGKGHRAPIPSGQWPDGTGESPVLPIPIAEFSFKQELRQ